MIIREAMLFAKQINLDQWGAHKVIAGRKSTAGPQGFAAWISEKAAEHVQQHGDQTPSGTNVDDRRRITNLQEFMQAYSIGHASGNNNECLLNTIVQLLAGTGITVDQMELHQNLLDEDIIRDGEMIDVYNVDVTQHVAAEYNVRFQVHERIGGSVRDHPVIGQTGPVLHIFYYNRHFSPVFNTD